MRATGIAFLVLAGFAACDSSSSDATRDKYGQCYEVAGRTCTGVKAYYDCIAAACGEKTDACLTPCAATFDCQRACACDAGNQACLTACGAAASTDCMACLAPAQACIQGAGCTPPSCITTPDGDVLVTQDP